jgi:GxxExxY protein
MNENELAKTVVDVAFHIHKTLGPGLLESVYQKIMAHELKKRGLSVEEEVPLPVIYDDIKMDVGFRVDLFVERRLIVELKSVERVAPVHKKTLLTYLRLSQCRLGHQCRYSCSRPHHRQKQCCVQLIHRHLIKG